MENLFYFKSIWSHRDVTGIYKGVIRKFQRKMKIVHKGVLDDPRVGIPMLDIWA